MAEWIKSRPKLDIVHK